MFGNIITGNLILLSHYNKCDFIYACECNTTSMQVQIKNISTEMCSLALQETYKCA